MLDFETPYGNFGNFKNMLLFMQEEHLSEINITKVTYCCNEIAGKGIYALAQIERLVEMGK